MISIKELEKLGLGALEVSREVILKYWGTDLEIELKGDDTPVTIADTSAERAVREWVKGQMPEAGFVGEEYGVENPDADYQWVIDPIDGTKSFMRGVPLFGTLLAIYYKGKCVFGAIDLPALGNTLHAIDGGGAWLDGKSTKVSTTKTLGESLLLTGTVNTFDETEYGPGFHKLRKQFGLHRGWGDAYGYFLVACGRADAMLDPIVSLWDVAPFPVIFREAGGNWSDLSGESQILESLQNGGELGSDDRTSLASNGLIHSEVLEKVNL